MFGSMHSVGLVVCECCDQFMSIHGKLTLRTAQSIKRARNEASLDGLPSFFCKLCHHIIERTIKKLQLLNMDEIGFIQQQDSCKVVVFKGSINVWLKCDNANFHMTFVIRVSADKYVAPPQLILPGKHFNRYVLKGLDIMGDNIKTVPRGLINYNLSLIWIELFEKSVPNSVARPLVLVYDDCYRHYNVEIVKKSIELKFIFVLLSANFTHFIHPLVVSFFNHSSLCFKFLLRVSF